jgi:hypothetical protein
MNLILVLLSALRSLIIPGKAASFKPALSGLPWERRCCACHQRQFVIADTWQHVGSVRNRRCGCRFVKEAA